MVGTKWDRRKAVVWSNGVVAKDFISTESSLEKSMGIKHKIRTHGDMRGGLPCAMPGDKPYAAAEYSNGFFKRPSWASNNKDAQHNSLRYHPAFIIV